MPNAQQAAAPAADLETAGKSCSTEGECACGPDCQCGDDCRCTSDANCAAN